MILKGKVEIFRNNGGQEESQKVRTLQGSELIYFESLFSQEGLGFYAKSVGNCSVLVINREEFMNLLRTDKQNFVQ